MAPLSTRNRRARLRSHLGDPQGSARVGCDHVVVIAPHRMSTPPATLPDSWTADVLILPREVVDGRGLYDDSVVTVAKELRAAGTSADYAHGPDAREWIGEKAVDAIVLSLIVGIASNAGWAGLRALLGRARSNRVRIRVARMRETLNGREAEWFELEGPADEVAEALRVLQEADETALEQGNGEES